MLHNIRQAIIAASLVASQFGIGILNLALLQLLIKELPVVEFATYGLLTTIFTFIFSMLSGPLSSAMSRFVIDAKNANEMKSVLRILLKSRSLCYPLFTIYVIIAATYYYINPTKSETIQNVMLFSQALFCGIMMGLNYCNNAVHNALRHRFSAIFFNLWPPLVRLLGIWFISLQNDLTLHQVFLIFTVISFVSLVLQDYWAQKIVSGYNFSYTSCSSESKLYNNKILAYAWPVMVMGAAHWITNSFDRYLFAGFFPAIELAKYTYLLQLAFAPIIMITSGMTQFAWPLLFKRSTEHINANSYIINKLTKIVILYFLILLMYQIISVRIFAFFDDFIFSEKLNVVALHFNLIITSGLIYSSSQFFSLAHEFKYDTKNLMKVKLTTALVGCLAYGTLGYAFGVDGVYFAHLFNSIFYLVSNFGSLCILQRRRTS